MKKRTLIPAVISLRHYRMIFLLSMVFLFSGSFLRAQTTYIYIYSPSSGQETYRNIAMDINWYSDGVDSVKLEFSLDNGTSWSGIISDYQGNAYTWTTPDTLTNQCVIRISVVADSTIFAEAGPFVISEIPTLFLNSPNGGETWNYGTTDTVSWSGTNLPTYLNLAYSIDGGVIWNSLGSGYGDSTGGTALVNVPLASSANALVKIYDYYHPMLIADSSDQPFTIYTPPIMVYSPYDGSEFYIKEEIYIQWNVLDTAIHQVNIDLSTDGGFSWQQIVQDTDANSGYFIWTASGAPSLTCNIRISDASNAAKFGLSGTFSLLATPVVTLTSPAGGEILNTNDTFIISWMHDIPSYYYLYLEYSIDNGLYWNYLGYGEDTALQGSFEWITPSTESEQCLIRISDYSLEFVNDTSNTFSILTYPATPVCMVTVDSATNRNIIVWEKPESPLINHFIVYKESEAAGIYVPIGTTNYGDFSTFADTNSNPAIKSYRYKLGFTDSVEHIFPPGSFHQSIHLSINQGVGDAWNLIWTNYIGFGYASYNIYRGNSPGNMTLITSISSSFNSYTDFEAPLGDIYYMLEVVNPDGCTPSFKAGGYNSSRSNIATNKTVGINDEIKTLSVSIYPNPASDRLSLNFTGMVFQTPLTVELRDVLGKAAYSDESVTLQKDGTRFIEVSNLHEGIYLLTFTAGERIMSRKIIVKH